MLPQPSLHNWSRFRTIRQVLDELCAVYGFQAAVLVSEEGLPLAAAASALDAETLAAIAGDLRLAARRAQAHLGWERLDELNVMAREGSRLVGRPIRVPDQDLMLVVVLPYWMSYQKATVQAVEVIRWAWKKVGSGAGFDAD